MAITIEELSVAYDDPLMIGLVANAARQLAATIIQDELTTSQGQSRLDAARNMLDDALSAAPPLWYYMVGVNTSSTLDDISRSHGSELTPSDTLIYQFTKQAIDALYPITP